MRCGKPFLYQRTINTPTIKYSSFNNQIPCLHQHTNTPQITPMNKMMSVLTGPQSSRSIRSQFVNAAGMGLTTAGAVYQRWSQLRRRTSLLRHRGRRMNSLMQTSLKKGFAVFSFLSWLRERKVYRRIVYHRHQLRERAESMAPKSRVLLRNTYFEADILC